MYDVLIYFKYNLYVLMSRVFMLIKCDTFITVPITKVFYSTDQVDFYINLQDKLLFVITSSLFLNINLINLFYVIKEL